ncbi:hypothetical protein SODALDRAFT_328633 [Sodiomyces alkalinus F11]|uniref:Mid2 domain-containing protein n=1 Tax=Sodiomyces alkalinus (strain CBS 110278 / VKM F-3762 / F11) TaxID=1314773 RepID=A0A3N2PLB5_SODAK|nr:hypothetical protein SODALDRAFT_328633 [Sodiomyces alkalinus F11]ROT35313.1 hypothetical protein SODALDRAFT_328633 [Sodiomyces alkalinus F11]
MARLQAVLLALCYGVRTAIAQEEHQIGAVELLPNGLFPRFLDLTPKLVRRDGPPCNPGHHRCIDVDEDGFCCRNDQYCYIRPGGQPGCCAIGSLCDSNCDATAYQCTTTITTSGTTSTSSACCGRSCPTTSFFQCESEYGGNCCPYGATCASGGLCRMTRSTTPSAIVTPIDPGCTATTQRSCSDGGGCCDEWMHCTEVDRTRGCAPGNPSNGWTFVPDPDAEEEEDTGGSGGLSTAARAGIGVGVTVGACALIGGVVWFFCFGRRRHRQEQQQHQQQQQQQQQQQNQGGAREQQQQQDGSRRSSQPISGTGSHHPRGRRITGDHTPGGQAMSDVATDISRPTRRRGLTQDYFGPAAVAGPFTETATMSPATSPGLDRGVPLMAQSPNDIAAPVEIDSQVSPALPRRDDAAGATVASASAPPQHSPAAAENCFELYGTEISPERYARQQSQGSLSPWSPILTPQSMRGGSEPEPRP